MNCGLGSGLAVIVVCIVFVLARVDEIQYLVLKSVLGLERDDLLGLSNESSASSSSNNVPKQTSSSPDNVKTEEQIRMFNVKLTKKGRQLTVLTTLFILLCAFILGLMSVIIFDGCFLSSAGLEVNDQCPEDPMDCFVFTDKDSILPNGPFKCSPGHSADFITNESDGYAWCYGWVIKRQTTRKVLDQIGICSGLIGLFGTILALIIYLAKHQKCFWILVSAFGAVILASMILLIRYKWSLSFLTYATLFMSGLCLVWGVYFFYIVGDFSFSCARKNNTNTVTPTQPAPGEASAPRASTMEDLT